MRAEHLYCLALLVGCSTHPAAPSTPMRVTPASPSSCSTPSAEPSLGSNAVLDAAVPISALPDAALEGPPTDDAPRTHERRAANHSSSPSSHTPKRARLPRSECSNENPNSCTPQVRIESFWTGDTQERADLRRTFRRNLGRLMGCYVAALRGDPRLAVLWSATARCDTPGAPCAIQTLTHNALPEFTTCLEQALTTMWSDTTDMPGTVQVELAFFMEKRQLSDSHGRL